MARRRTIIKAISGTAHSITVTRSGRMRDSIHTATPSMRAPNTRLTVSIQAPARGSSCPADAPTTSSGTPMPIAIENSASPPRTTWPVWPMTVSAATSAGPTQVVTISADSAPMTATPAKLPPRWRLLISERRVCTKLGICTVYRPNIDSDIAMNSSANVTMIQGCWNSVCACWPAAANATPAAV